MRDVVALETARVAEPVGPLVVGDDDVADRPVAVHLGDDAGALVGVAADLLPVLLGEANVGLEDAIREHELADVVQQAGGMGELLVALREACGRGDLARVAGDRGAVAGGRAVAQVERAEQRAEQRDLEAGELLRADLELVGALLGKQHRAKQVLEDEDPDRGEAECRRPEGRICPRRRLPRASPRRVRREGLERGSALDLRPEARPFVVAVVGR